MSRSIAALGLVVFAFSVVSLTISIELLSRGIPYMFDPYTQEGRAAAGLPPVTALELAFIELTAIPFTLGAAGVAGGIALFIIGRRMH